MCCSKLVCNVGSTTSQWLGPPQTRSSVDGTIFKVPYSHVMNKFCFNYILYVFFIWFMMFFRPANVYEALFCLFPECDYFCKMQFSSLVHFHGTNFFFFHFIGTVVWIFFHCLLPKGPWTFHRFPFKAGRWAVPLNSVSVSTY